jgi:endonuclease YncB( thermonuclease family)
MLKRLYIISLTLFLVPASITSVFSASEINGKVVAIAGGDSITALQNRTQYKIRLYGVDTQEKS